MSEDDIKDEQKQMDMEDSDGSDNEAPDAEEPDTPRPVAQEEAYEPPSEISEEEKKLVESMTSFMNSMVDDDKE